MSQRIPKVESLIQQVVATAVRERLEGSAASVTVTRVDAAPDLRNATVWFGLLGSEEEQAALMAELRALQPEIQAELAERLTIKFVPRMHFRLDTGGAYAADIERLLKGL